MFLSLDTYRGFTLLETLCLLGVDLCVIVFVIYVCCICHERERLKDAINNLVYYNTHCNTNRRLTLLTVCPQAELRQRLDRIQRRIESLETEPAFFGSPLYIARLQLRTEIKSKLDELKIELKKLETKLI